MKAIVTILSLAICLVTNAQQKVVNAIIYSTTTISTPEESEDISQAGGGGGRMGGFGGFDGDIKTTTYIKDTMTKTIVKNEMMNNTIITNNKTKYTVMLMQMMGKKMGFYSTEEELKNMGRKMMDSMADGPKKDSMIKKKEQDLKSTTILVPTAETKKIAGYNAIKGYLVTTNFLGQKDSSTVWYTPEIKVDGLASTTGMMRMGRGNSSGNQFDAVPGLVLNYTNKIGNGRVMEVTIDKIDLKKDIEDKEFAIPGDYDLKPMSELRNMFGGGGNGGGRATIRTQ